MSESDQTWNAAGDEPAATNDLPEASATQPAPTAPPPSAATRVAAVLVARGRRRADRARDAGDARDHRSLADGLVAADHGAARDDPDAAGDRFTPLGAPGPYATGPSDAPGTVSGSGGAGRWGPPPGWVAATPGWPPAAPAPAPAPAPASTMRKRGLAIVAAVALVFASAGVGAGIADRGPRRLRTTTPFDAGPSVQPNTGTNSEQLAAATVPSTLGNGHARHQRDRGEGRPRARQHQHDARAGTRRRAPAC